MAAEGHDSTSNDAGSFDSNNEHKRLSADAAADEKPRPVEPLFERENPWANNSGEKRREITEAECQGKLGYHYPSWKKWTILSVIFTVQVSMNL